MKRMQVCRPMLCDYGCEVIQEWDDEDDPPVVVTKGLRRRCDRHRDSSEKDALNAIAEQDRLEGQVWTAVDGIAGLSADHVAAGLRMADDGTLHVTINPKHAAKLQAALADERIVVK